MNTKRILLIFSVLSIIVASVSCKKAGDPAAPSVSVPTADTSGEISIRENEKGGMFSEKDLDPSLPAGGTEIILGEEKDLLQITEEGTRRLSGTMNGTVEIDVGKTGKLNLILAGAVIDGGNCPAIRILSADKVFLWLEEGTENTLSGVSTETESSEDGAIFSKEDLTVKGSGSLTVSSPAGHGIVCKDDLKIIDGTVSVIAGKHGLAANDSVRICGGSLTVTSGKDGIHTENTDDTSLGYYYQEEGKITVVSGGDGIDASGYIHITNGEVNAVTGGGAGKTASSGYGRYQTATETVSTKGLKSNAAILIDGGQIALDCKDDAVHGAGNVSVSSGLITVKSGDDGIHSDASVLISGGTITVSESYEGLEGVTVGISGGDITIRASDDGINASDGSSGNMGPGGGFFGFGVGGIPGSGSSSCVIAFSGGVTHVIADGDGVDSNGTIVMSGGELYISGPTSSADCAFDYETGAEITGGILVAAGASGMAENVTSATQGCALVSLSGSEKITLKDESGKTLVEYEPEKTYQCVLISCPGMEKGKNYTLSTPSSALKIALTELIYGGGMGGPGGPGVPGDPRDPGGPGGPGGFPGRR